MFNLYFEWLMGQVMDDDHTVYTELLWALFNTEFIYSVDHDVNRYMDGLDLRQNYEQQVTNEYRLYDDKPCSVLEMMIALSQRIETSIMADDIYGNRTREWFWGMIDNLGLSSLDNLYFDANIYADRIGRFLTRQYASDGTGGLFRLNNTRGRDMRDTEIWYQAMWYLAEVLQEEKI